ncbi:MAG: adenosylcobinamide kinase [Clostridiales bacterium]|nr:adenosylcobinamide kinase [Clostridiales bacterium]
MILIVGGANQGKKAYTEKHFGKDYKIIEDYHKQVEQEWNNGKNPIEEAEKLLQSTEKLVIISNELGYGLVPIDKFEREYREINGRVNCYLAEQAEQVIRVICGIGTQIK